MSTYNRIVTDEMVGRVVTFYSKNPVDPSLWRGTIRGVVAYDLAKMFSDVTSYNASVQRADATVDVAENLHYFLIEVGDSTSHQTKAFAEEWIVGGSFIQIEIKDEVVVGIYDSASNDHAKIIALLKSAGYSAYIKTVNSGVAVPN